jgi:hypothetical protein
MPKGENDGPPGAVSLAKILYKGLGAVPVYIGEECHIEPIVASSHAAGLMIKEFRHARDHRLGAAVAIAPTNQSGVAKWTDALFTEMKPKAVVSAERLGPGLDGIIYSATVLPFSVPQSTVEYPTIDISAIVTEASRREVLTIGIGDHGNEIGFGHIHSAVAKAMPKGEVLCTKIATDIVLPAMMSNWGCYGIEAALAYLLKRPELIHPPAQEARIIRVPGRRRPRSDIHEY